MGCINFAKITPNKKTLLFPPCIERTFFLQGLASKVSFLKTGIFILWCLNLLLQYYNFSRLTLIPSLLMLPLPIVLVLLKNRRYETHIDFFCGLALFFTGTAVISMITHFPGEFLNFLVLVFIIISGFVFFKIRYLVAGVTGFILVAMHGLTLLYFADVQTNMILHNTFFLFFITVITMTAGYII